MTATIGYATLQIIPSTKGALTNLKADLGGPLDRAGDEAGTSSSKKFSQKFKDGLKIAGSAIGGAAVGAFLKSAVGAASDVSESMSKVNVVFGKSSQGVIDWSKNAATAMGQSQGQALEAVGTFGNLLTGFGLGGEQTTKMSKSMVQLASDMASFNNTSVDEALTALQSGLTGETEPLKKFGVALNDAAIKAEAVKEGLIATTSDALTPAQKAQASYALILANTSTAQGDFARTSGGLANQQKILGARFDDAKAKIGAVLLPILTQLTSFLSGNMTPVLIALGVVLGVMFGIWVAGAIAAAAASLGAAAPFVAVGIAVAAVAAAVIYAYTHFAIFRDIVDSVVDVFQAIWAFISANILPILKTLIEIYIKVAVEEFKLLWAAITTVIDIFRSMWNFITGSVLPVFQSIIDTIVAVATWVHDKVNDIVGFITGIPSRIWNTVVSLFDGIKTNISAAKDWVKARIDDVIGFVSGIPKRIGDVLSGVKDAVTAPFKLAFNGIATIWNNTIGKLSFHIPDWVPGIGGKGFDVPDIPMFSLHTGGVVPGAAGADVPAILRAGEVVLTAGQQSRLLALANGSDSGVGLMGGDRVTLVIEGTPITGIVQRSNRELAAQIGVGKR